MKIKFTVETDPLPQPRPRFSDGRIGESSKVRKYKKLVSQAAALAMKGKAVFDIPLKCKLKFYRKTARRVDVDNLAKSVLDALNNIVWRDDSQIFSLTAEKYLKCEKPRVEVQVYSAPKSLSATEKTIARRRK